MIRINFEKKEINYIISLMNCIDDEKAKKIIKKLKRALKPIKIASRKAKGRILQQYACNEISDLIGIPYTKDDDSLIKSREMGQSGVDVVLIGEAQKRFPFSIECKNAESFSFAKTIEQIKNNLKDNTDWMIFHKRKELSNTIIIMEWNSFKKHFKK